MRVKRVLRDPLSRRELQKNDKPRTGKRQF
jgi:hypothetical protein